MIDKRIKLLFLKILHGLIFTNEALSHSGQKICFHEIKVLTFKIVYIFRNKHIFFRLNTFKSLTLALTSPIVLDHIKMSFPEYKQLQKYSGTLTLVFHVDSKETQKYIRDEQFTFLCTH